MFKELDVTNHELENLAFVVAKRFIQRRDLYPKQLDDGRYICITCWSHYHFLCFVTLRRKQKPRRPLIMPQFFP